MSAINPTGPVTVQVGDGKHVRTFQAGSVRFLGAEPDPASVPAGIKTRYSFSFDATWEMPKPMTEQEWLTTTDPERMLQWAQAGTIPTAGGMNLWRFASERKHRLYEAARLRSTAAPGDGIALAVADRMDQRADGIDPGGDSVWDFGFMSGWIREAVAVRAILNEDPLALSREWAVILRCLFGNPFQPVTVARPLADPHHVLVRRRSDGAVIVADVDRLPVTFPRFDAPDEVGEVLEPTPWLTPAVFSIAVAIYNELRWEDMPVLADALEESGCTDKAILAHCREPGPHGRGCFVLDLLLGKE